MRFELINRSALPFIGWHRTVIDPTAVPKEIAALKIPRGLLRGDGEARFALGRVISPNSQVLDLQVKLAPGMSMSVDTEQWVPKEWEPDPLPVPVEKMGWPKISGYNLQDLGWWFDGAAIVLRYGVRLPPSQLIACFLTLRYALGDDIAVGTVTVCANNPDVPDLQCELPRLTLTGVGVAQSTIPINPGVIGDGQARHWPVAVAFTEEAVPKLGIVVNRHIHGHGVRTVGPLGNVEQMRFDPVAWRALAPGVQESTRGYAISWPPVGVAANATVTGDQEDQGFASQGFESLFPGGVGADLPRYWAALGQARQPCHRLTRDGAMLMPEDIPDAMMWQGTWLWINKKSNSGSWLLAGKPRQVTHQDTSGWFGPDREHKLLMTLFSAYELSGEEALRWEIEHHARNYLWEDTVEAGLSTSGPDAARSFGWAGIAVAGFLRLLPPGALRDRVLQRWIDRMEKVYLPAWGSKLVWQLFESKVTEINPANYARMWPAYQQGIGSAGGYVGCQEALKLTTDTKHVMTLKLGTAMCVAGAEHVVDRCYEIYPEQAQPGQAPPFKEWELIGSDEAGNLAPHWHNAPYVEGVSAHRTGWFRHAWMPPALWLVSVASQKELRHLARSVRHTLMGELRGNPNNRNLPDWYPPLPAGLS